MADAELETVASLFRLLAEIDYRGASPLYERLAREGAEDPELLELLLPAAPQDRLPHLLFAAVDPTNVENRNLGGIHFNVRVPEFRNLGEHAFPVGLARACAEGLDGRTQLFHVLR